MRRKTLSPAFITAILIALTSMIFCLVFYLQANNVKSIYGKDIRLAIYELNELTGKVPGLVESGTYEEIVKTAARFEVLTDAGLLHPDIDSARLAAADALYAYAEGVFSGRYSDSAMKLLSEDALSASDDLRLLVQHAISRLADSNTTKMDRNYFKSMNAGTKLYKELSLLAANGD
ncbi:MAG: hypothetical protein PUA83_08675 [Clostridiales bacterium]|nr:hypothetical protein [Clostridiales bacterium]